MMIDEIISRTIEIRRRKTERGSRLTTERIAYGTITQKPDKMLDCEDMATYHRHERTVVAALGNCTAGCDATSLVVLGGRTVCPHTFENCPNQFSKKEN